ncbi:MAG: ATP-dependent DNA helicase [Desulfobulbaceae bacterium]|nr:ATP-dependent DNA helicase [Desulfobulbaceae bacterium]
MDELLAKIKNIFSPGGILSTKLPGFEARAGQLAMATAVAQNFTGDESFSPSAGSGTMLAVEAETGIGKTLAYLVPAALSNQKVVVSTGTLNLQEQILNKEIPFIKEHIAPHLSALCVKGRQNYLCLYRWHQLYDSPQLPLFDNDHLDAVADWLGSTHTGDRAELDWLPDHSSLWREVSATSSQCLGTICPDGADCFINQLRKKAARTQLLIVNHHLFFSDLALRRFGFAEVLPRYESVIFDEAHHIENIATRYFGNSVSHFQLLDLAQDIEKLLQENAHDKSLEKISSAVNGLTAEAVRFLRIFPEERGRFPLHEAVEKISNWEEECLLLTESLSGLISRLDSQAQRSDIWGGMQRRAQELLTNLQIVTGQQRSSYVYWYERRDKSVAVSASPIEIAEDLQKSLFPEVRTAIFTSATLTTGGNFSYFFERLGLPATTNTLRLASPFDYAGRTELFVPANMPEPAAPTFLKELQHSILDILLASRGRALVLFTSIKAMHYLFHYLEERLPFPVFMQGSAPKQTLLDRFSNETHSVLLAVASFWEGVDVPGETLSCVIIDKLPFEVPSDPVIMARIAKIKDEGGNPFVDFQIPRAILTLRQGLGRLMRSSTDSGLLAIMDVRLFTKRYGRLFLKSLPDSPIIRTLEEVTFFFHEKADTVGAVRDLPLQPTPSETGE